MCSSDLGNYLTTLMFGAAAQTSIILGSPHIAVGIVAGSLVIGLLLGVVVYGVMKLAVWLIPNAHGLRLQASTAHSPTH